MALVVHQPELAIRPYCGARLVINRSTEDSHCSSDRRVYGAPVRAWVDDSLAGHLHGAVVPYAPSQVPSGESEPAPYLKSQFSRQRCFFKAGVVIVAVFENLACYLAYFESRAPEARFYNKYQAHFLLLPGLDTTVLVLACMNTVWLFVSWVLLFVVQVDAHETISAARLLPSGISGIICTVIVLFGESTVVFAFVCSACVFLNLILWVLLGRCPGEREPQTLQEEKIDPSEGHRARVRLAIRLGFAAFLIAVTLTWLLLFSLDAMVFLRNENCVATRNTAMPVRIDGVPDWQCARWGETHYVQRKPDESKEVLKAFCSTTFQEFNKLSASNTWIPGIGAHRLHCPPQCQSLGLSGAVLGCQVYDAGSSVCAAAVQMGVLEPDQEGVVVVIGRPPPTSGRYEKCNLNTVKSTSGPVPTQAAVDPNSTAPVAAPPWSFYFQVPGLETHDMVTLHDWSRSDAESVNLNEPWRNYVADVSWVIGGMPGRTKVVLGPSAAAAVELNFCHRADNGGPSNHRDCP
eukprot:TRINITY_DN37758_c0_g1_i1.p1 TRINITY_DN37758_c0_g1~~TRINITY_DN37758_c0_g1_i1.p1  ORF type:complete len:519 (+),score=63.21 TRINITY_DN37758_c0_g1_i1:64-1620(+)